MEEANVGDAHRRCGTWLTKFRASSEIQLDGGLVQAKNGCVGHGSRNKTLSPNQRADASVILSRLFALMRFGIREPGSPGFWVKILDGCIDSKF